MNNYQTIFHRHAFNPSKSMDSLILCGGRGTRLETHRKTITPQSFPLLPGYWGTEGPKALALLEIGGQCKPFIDWHFDLYRHNQPIDTFYLGLGYAGQMMQDYIEKIHHNSYNSHRVHCVVEQNPAGTLAPLIKLYEQNLLTDKPILMANGDNILMANFYDSYLKGCCYALEQGINPDEAVIDLAAMVRYEKSDQYGVLDIDHEKHLARSFCEKQAIEKNPFEEINGQKICWINSGFSIILNPRVFAEKYLNAETISLSKELEELKRDYKSHEKAVKYETVYEKIAGQGQLIAIKQQGYWADSGTEELIKGIEEYYRAHDF